MGGPYFLISCMIFHYYPEIHFYTHFWNSNSRKKNSLTPKNSIFEGLFSIFYWELTIVFSCRGFLYLVWMSLSRNSNCKNKNFMSHFGRVNQAHQNKKWGFTILFRAFLDVFRNPKDSGTNNVMNFKCSELKK